MATSDLHVHVLGYDYYTDSPSPHVGLAHTATLIAKARAEVGNSLLFDNGDFLQGNPMGDYFAQSRGRAKGTVHPVFAAMNKLGYDVATLGNHEFNYGLDFLMAALRGAKFPVVSANIARKQGRDARQDETLLAPYVILARQIIDTLGQPHMLRIGIIGFAPPQIVQWDRSKLEGQLFTRDIVETAAVLVPQMKAEGADIIVALSHSGIGAADTQDGAENASTSLAQVPGIDALITGHSHLVFPSPAFEGLAGIDVQTGTIFGKPAVMPGFYGSHLGVIDLTLGRADAEWRVVKSTSAARPILTTAGTLRPAAEIAATVRNSHRATLTYARRPIGRSNVPLNTYTASLAPSAAVAIVAAAQAAHVARQLQDTSLAGVPIISAAAPFKSGGRGGPQNYTAVPAGDMALRHAADLYIFPNTIAALPVTGSQITEWLENAVGIYRQIPPGSVDVPLIDPDFPSYNYDMIYGLDLEIDLSKPARYDRHGVLVNPDARRLRQISWQGRPLQPESQFILATNSYRSSGCGGFAGTADRNALDVGRANIRDILLRHITTNSPILPCQGSHWRFVPMPGTTATFDTAPEAKDHLYHICALSPMPIGLTSDGFARFRIHL